VLVGVGCGSGKDGVCVDIHYGGVWVHGASGWLLFLLEVVVLGGGGGEFEQCQWFWMDGQFGAHHWWLGGGLRGVVVVGSILGQGWELDVAGFMLVESAVGVGTYLLVFGCLASVCTLCFGVGVGCPCRCSCGLVVFSFVAGFEGGGIQGGLSECV